MFNITKKLTVNTLFRERFSMEEISNNITHTNDKNKYQSSNQNVRCGIYARSFRTNRGLLHLNFCCQRNINEGNNLNGNIQTSNIKHDNLNNNEVFEISSATNSCQNNQNKNWEYFYWNDVAGTQFANELDNSYESIVHWKRNLFMLPSGAAETILKK